MKQFLLTRFNIIISHKLGYSFDTETDRDYLTERFKLFEKYTIPSVADQSAEDFKWIVLFSDRTPDEFRERINGYEKQYDFFVPRYLGADQVYPRQYVLRDSLHGILREFTTERLILTRVDNDDVIAQDYLDNVRKEAEKKGNGTFAINFDYGLQYDEDTGILIRYHRPHNHFFSICTDMDDTFMDPLCQHHENIEKTMELYVSDNKRPQWMEVLHGGNVKNFSHAKPINIIRKGKKIKNFGCMDDLYRRNTFSAYLQVLKDW